MEYDELKVGKRVLVKSLGIKGTITYIDQATLYVDHYFPIQLELDTPYPPDDTSSLNTTHRTFIKDLKPVKKGRRKK